MNKLQETKQKCGTSCGVMVVYLKTNDVNLLYPCYYFKGVITTLDT